MERTSPLFEFKRASLSSAGEFVGYASTFGGPPDSYGDIIADGAFSKSLAEHSAAGTKPAMLWAHDMAEPIGVFTNMTEDATGLKVEGKLSLGSQRGKDAYALMQDGALALSIGFSVYPDGLKYEDGRRLLTSIKLWEISAVALPANPKAKITAVKSVTDIRSYEATLRDALGFSARDARKLASAGWPAYAKVKGQPDYSEHIALLRKSASKFKG